MDIIGEQLNVDIPKFRLWRGADSKMYDIEALNWDKDSILGTMVVIKDEHGKYKNVKVLSFDAVIPCTGLSDGKGVMLYYGDLVLNTTIIPNRIAMIFWDNGWRIFGMSTDMFKLNVKDKIIRVGSRWTQHNMYMEYVLSVSGKKPRK